MRAHARVRVERCDGRSVLRELRSDPPLTLRATVDGVHLVGSGAGPLGGDELRLDVTVGGGARLDLFSVAAMLVQPAPTPAVSSMIVDVEVGADATLAFRPQPAILVRGCDHHQTTNLRLADGAAVLWREETVFGRHDEATGSVRQRLRVDIDGVPLLRNEVVVGERWPSSLGPAGVGTARAMGSLLVVGAGADADRLAALVTDDVVVPPYSGVMAAALGLDGPGVLVSVLGDRSGAVTGVLDRIVAALLEDGRDALPAGR